MHMGLCNGYTQASHAKNATYAQAQGSDWHVEAKTLLSRQSQSDYNDYYLTTKACSGSWHKTYVQFRSREKNKHKLSPSYLCWVNLFRSLLLSGEVIKSKD